MIVTIDGPAGAGKSTTAKLVAARLGFRYLDTGAMYRAVTAMVLGRGAEPGDAAAATAVAESLSLDLRPDGTVLANGRDLTTLIRTERVTAGVSEVSAHPGVRTAMTRIQRDIGRLGDLVCEGRDMGSVVFPDAPLKIWLDAPIEVRAERRRKELEGAGESLSLDELVLRLVERDRKDSARATAPLKRVDDQTFVDTAGLSVAQVVEKITALATAARTGGRV